MCGRCRSASARTRGSCASTAIGRLAPRFVAALNDPQLRDRLVSELLRSEFPEDAPREHLGRGRLGPARTADFCSQGPEVPAGWFRWPTSSDARSATSAPSCWASMSDWDAAHVRMHSKDGPSTIDNGVLLCALHHRLFDKGALGLDEDRRILVSQQLSVVDSLWHRSLLDLSGRRMRLPQRAYQPPAVEHIEWHHEKLVQEASTRTRVGLSGINDKERGGKSGRAQLQRCLESRGHASKLVTRRASLDARPPGATSRSVAASGRHEPCAGAASRGVALPLRLRWPRCRRDRLRTRERAEAQP